jgi:hypothetical protein
MATASTLNHVTSRNVAVVAEIVHRSLTAFMTSIEGLTSDLSP